MSFENKVNSGLNFSERFFQVINIKRGELKKEEAGILEHVRKESDAFFSHYKGKITEKQRGDFEDCLYRAYRDIISDKYNLLDKVETLLKKA